MVVLGDFGQGPDSSDHDLLRKERFHPLVPAHTFTNISTKNPQGSKSLDNIWISKSLRKVFTGKARRASSLLLGKEVSESRLNRQRRSSGLSRRQELPTSSGGRDRVTVPVAI